MNSSNIQNNSGIFPLKIVKKTFLDVMSGHAYQHVI
jgi:hypothetical protein